MRKILVLGLLAHHHRFRPSAVSAFHATADLYLLVFTQFRTENRFTLFLNLLWC